MGELSSFYYTSLNVVLENRFFLVPLSGLFISYEVYGLPSLPPVRWRRRTRLTSDTHFRVLLSPSLTG